MKVAAYPTKVQIEKMTCHKCGKILRKGQEAWALGEYCGPALLFHNQDCAKSWLATHPFEDYFLAWKSLMEMFSSNLKTHAGMEFSKELGKMVDRAE